MKPDDILNAIGEVDDAYIKKAHRKSFLKALLVFTVIATIGIAIVVSQMEKDHILLRFNTDGSVNTGYIEPEVLIHDKWTSMEQTSYADGVPISTTKIQYTLFTDYAIIHTENGETVRIVGSASGPLTPRDYLESEHYANLYIHSYYRPDLLDRPDVIGIYSDIAYGGSTEELNYLDLEYLERGNRISRQTRLENGTTEGTIIGYRGYSSSSTQILGWNDWDSEYNLLAYAEYIYDGNTQTVHTYLADGTLTGTRISKYSFGDLRWREYYDAEGELTGREVYRYRPWELFFCLEGFASLIVILSLAATAGIAVWDDRIQLGTKLVAGTVVGDSDETKQLIREVEDAKTQMAELSGKLSTMSPNTQDIAKLTEELKKLNDHLDRLLDFRPDSQ